MILVTGGTGFLGSTLIKQLIDAGKAVVATKRPASVVPEKLKSSSLVEWVDADVTDYFALSDVFPQVKQVYHCAAKVSYQKEDAASMQKINVEGTQHIVNLCLLHQVRLIHVSSIAALGTNKTGAPVSETDKWEYDKKISKYALSKYKSELEVWRGIKEGLDAVIVNPSVIMGLGSPHRGSGVIFDLVNKGLKIYPPGSVGIVDVEDVARVMITLMDNTLLSGERYILNSENLTNKDLIHRIASLLNKKKPGIQATPFMLDIAWRAAKLVAFLTRGKPSLTKESTQAAAAKLAYTNNKIIEALGGYSFKPVDQTLQEITNEYYI